MKTAFQMDPIGAVDIDADSSFRLAEEAQARGHELFFYTPDHISWRQGRIIARGNPLELRRVKGDHFTLGEEAEVEAHSILEKPDVKVTNQSDKVGRSKGVDRRRHTIA